MPAEVAAFLADYGKLLAAVAVSGNRNWGARYGAAGDIISRVYDVPLIHRFELSGTPDDVRKFTEEVTRLELTHRA